MIRCCELWIALLSFAGMTMAQSLTTGAISGTLVDQGGAVMPGVTVTATNTNTGAKRTAVTSGSGTYVIAQLDPGVYRVEAQSSGFKTAEVGQVTVAVSRVASVNFSLKVGEVTENVTVNEGTPLIETSNPNTTTTFNAKQLADLPLAGMDLTSTAYLAPGVLINTASANQGNAGNFEVNGLPSIANAFTIDGLDVNDPFTNSNLRGASGLQLGLNAMQEVTVNTVPYSVDQGRLGASQVNYVTKSGTNAFHGNAFEVWNGSAMNARNFFLNAQGTQRKPRSNVNEFGASLGGPILKDKLFFFADLEGIRLVLPVILSSTLPTPAYQDFVLQQLPLGGRDTVLGTNLPPQPGEMPLYQKMFSLMGDTSQGVPLRVIGCPFDVGGGPPAVPNTGNGCASRRAFSASPFANETLFTIKLDYNRSANNSFWYRFQLNQGRSTQVDPVNSIFNVVTPRPVRAGAAGWTHIFSPRLVNQFNPGFSYVSAISDLADPPMARAALPIAYSVPPAFSAIGSALATTPDGTATTVWQLNDNLTWGFGRHDLKFGTNLRRPLSSILSGSFVTPLVIGFSLPEFTFGAAGNTIQSFPKAVGERIASVNLDAYAMDTFKATSKLTLTFGVRVAWNSDPVSRKELFSRLNGSFQTILHDVNRPLNSDILANQEKLYPSTPLLQWQPRVAIAYGLNHHTVLRAGFGVHGQALETSPSFSSLFRNPPSNAIFRAGLFTPLGGVAIAPGVPNSAVDIAIAANQRFQSGFATGALSCSSPLSSPNNCLPPVSLTLFGSSQGNRLDYPYYMQWSAAIERQFGNDFGLTVSYAATRALRGFYDTSPNGLQTVCPGCFVPFPFGNIRTPPDPRFGSVLSLQTGANSTFHGLQITAKKRVSHGLTFQANYTDSHCLDTVSNGGNFIFNVNAQGGVSSPTRLRRFYGNCDFDIRHSLNGSYIYELPFHSKKSWLDGVLGGWQISGTVFMRGGFPFSVVSASPAGGFINFSPTILANAVPGQNPYTGTDIPGVTQPGTIQWLNPNAFQSVIDRTTNQCFPTNNPQNCQDGNLGRNTLRAPGFRWTDLDLGKRFRISETISFKFDAQFYNLFNHPNFGIPGSGSFGVPTAGIPGKTATLVAFGTIRNTVAPSTGLLGGRSGGDSSVRMIALRGTFQF